jgi:hypothetical protein
MQMSSGCGTLCYVDYLGSSIEVSSWKKLFGHFVDKVLRRKLVVFGIE